MEFIKLKQTWPFIKTCLKFLNTQEKIKAFLISYLLLFSSVLEMLALLFIMPFVSLIIDPKVVLEKDFYKILENFIGKQEIDNLIIIFATSSLIFLIISLFSSFLIQHYVRLFVVKCQNRLAKKIVIDCINAPYLWFLEQNSVTKPHYLQTDILMWANDGILRIMHMIGSITLLVVASITLIYVSFLTGIFGLVLVLGLSLVIVNLTRAPISDLSDLRRISNTSSLSTFSQIFKGIKDIRMNSSEKFFVDSFLKNFSIYGLSGAKLRLFQNIAPVVIMALGQVCLILISLSLWFSKFTGAEIASLMAFIILIVSRLVPNINKLINDLNGIWAALPHVKSLENHNKVFLSNKIKNKTIDKFKLGNWKEIKLHDVSFKYPKTKNYVLYKVNLKINSGKSYAIVGKSGSGKTTMIDIILGLLKPSNGKIFIDKKNLNQDLHKHWLTSIGYVPQVPFIADDTIKNNIAFGIQKNEIDEKLLAESVSISQLENFVKKLPMGLDTEIGELGSKLSGGQKQRIAIARALYNRPKLLILDEATSAIDGINEKAFQESLKKLDSLVTTITIAHKMTTIQNCDYIIVLENGNIKDKGNFEELKNGSSFFRNLLAKN